MSDFNLVPQEFVDRESKRAAFRWVAVATIAMVVLCGGLFASAGLYVDGREGEMNVLREQQAISMRQRDQLKALQKRKEQLLGDRLLLASLRSGATVPALVSAIESARTSEDVRFESWHFRRAGILIEDEAEARPPSYFVVADKPEAFPKSWESMTHMTIHGEAKDHAALSLFVQRLFAQPNIDDVRIQRSSQTLSGVAFHLAVVVRTQEGQA